MMKKITKEQAKHYYWKDVCDGWHFLERDDLSIIVEKMPPHTCEDRHYHQYSHQFFYILEGTALMRFADHDEVINANEGIEIPCQIVHQMINQSESDLHFIVVSKPKSHGDRINVEEE